MDLATLECMDRDLVQPVKTSIRCRRKKNLPPNDSYVDTVVCTIGWAGVKLSSSFPLTVPRRARVR